MHDVMSGVRVLEVASWTFVPAAGAVLADWGADVLKIEHPATGDPQRGLITSGLVPGGADIPNFMIEQPNRGKRSVGIDIGTDAGRELLYRLAETADVFLTNFLPGPRARLKIDVEDIRARNPRIIYARGTGQGTRGPDATKGGYDGASYWARGTAGVQLTPGDRDWPISQTPAFGDLQGAQTIAGGIAAALFHRERTGEAKIVDISLLGTAMWAMSPFIVAAKLFDMPAGGTRDRRDMPNPIVNAYRTSDGRFLSLVMLESDRFWADLCEHLGRPDLIADERFVDSRARATNSRACVEALDEVFAQRTLAEWRAALETVKGVWSVYQTPLDVHDDPQVAANGYVLPVSLPGAAKPLGLVANPVQFDETPPTLRPAPGHGEHTDEVLTELGLSMDEIIEHKISGAIL